MKRINKGQEPASLKQFRAISPEANWLLCMADQPRKEEIQGRLRQDQGGICCYCEIDLIPAGKGKADFRIEHFHPKSDRTTAFNWNIDWQNLLCCCHGGSERYVSSAATRYTRPDYSCDVPKGDEDWDAVILKPTDIPASPNIFIFHRVDGADQISVEASLEGCSASGVDATKAQQTIDRLQLDAPRLKRLRKAELDHLNATVQSLEQAGQDLADILDILASSQLTKDADGNWPSFFSAKRCYLGDAAEQYLAASGYAG